MSENETPETVEQKPAIPSSKLRVAPPGIQALMQANADGMTDPQVVPMSEEEKAFRARLKLLQEQEEETKASGAEQFINRAKPEGPSVG